MSTTHRLQTQRLELLATTRESARAAANGDRAQFAKLIDAHVPDEWPPEIMADAQEWLARSIEVDPTLVGWAFWYVIARETRTLIGGFGFKGHPVDGRLDVGYSLIDRFQGQGLATEGMRALVDFGFANPAVQRMVGETFPELTRSIRVMEKLGFEFVGEFAAGFGGEPDVVQYAVTRERWAARKSLSGGDMPAAEFRAALHRAADMAADYLERSHEYPVLPRISPGDIRRALPTAPPQNGESFDSIFADFARLIEPNVTHWNHPGFLAYFANTGSGPGIIAETLTAALNNNAMVWKTGPASTELEETVCDWLRQAMSLPAEFVGHINDTASTGTLMALAAARHWLGIEIRERGMAGRTDLPPITLYCSDQAHSSIDKAALCLGLGAENVRRVASDAEFRMRPDALERAIRDDIAVGKRPMAVVATVGTTSTTSIDPVRAIAEICAAHSIWLHVDSAYAGCAAICPEYRALMEGIERADTLVVNPHKWLFAPMDCSVLFTRHRETFRAAFSLIPDYLRTDEAGVFNLMDYGIPLGRRFRSLKLWMVLRSFGIRHMQSEIRRHCALAREFADWIRTETAAVPIELSAPAPFSVVNFRAVPPGAPEAQDRFNERLLSAVNSEGPHFLSHTKLNGRFVIHLAVGNMRTTRDHVRAAWDSILRHAADLR